MDTSGRLKPDELGGRLVEGGRENDGTAIFVAQANHKGSVYPGKASARLDGVFFFAHE